MDDNSSSPWLTPGVDNDSSDWIPLDLRDLAPSDRSPIPFRLFAKRFKSSSPDSEWFLHDPLKVLMSELDLDPEIAWHITTLIVNHHRKLSFIHLFAMAVVAHEEGTVALTIYKMPG
jgi:hypothetical protein